MNKPLLLGGLLAGLGFSHGALAASLDVDLNKDTLTAQYHFSDRNAELGISAGAMVTDDYGELVHLTLRTQGYLADQNFIRGGFGLRAYFASPDGGDDYQALGLGGFVDVEIPQVPDLTVGVELYYAPSITLTDDLDNQREMTVRARYQLFKNASVYAGIRYLEVEQESADVDFEFDDGPHAGFTLQF